MWTLHMHMGRYDHPEVVFVATAMSTSARSMGFDYFGATMGRTGWPILIHYAIGDSACQAPSRMLRGEPPAAGPTGTVEPCAWDTVS